MCYEFLKFAECSVAAKYGIVCPYAHSIYEVRKFAYDNKDQEQPGFTNIWASNPDEPAEQRPVRIPDKSSICKEILRKGICNYSVLH